MTKDFLKDTVKYLPAQIAPGIVGFISIPIITRIFLPQDYGKYSLVMATVMVLTALVGWLPMSIIRFYPAYERDKKFVYSIKYWLRMWRLYASEISWTTCINANYEFY